MEKDNNIDAQTRAEEQELGLLLLSALAQKGPEDAFRLIFEERRFEEIARFDGINERMDYHPEGDVGLHMRLVLLQAFELSKDLPKDRALRVRLAALTHDLGKAVTGGAAPDPMTGAFKEFDAQKASHAGHDDLGAQMMKGFFWRYGLPEEHLAFCSLVALWHQGGHNLFQNGKVNRNASSLCRNLFLSLKEAGSLRLEPLRLAQRSAQWSEDFAMALEADALGRLLPRDTRVYPQAQMIRALRGAMEKLRWKESAADPQALWAQEGVGIIREFIETEKTRWETKKPIPSGLDWSEEQMAAKLELWRSQGVWAKKSAPQI